MSKKIVVVNASPRKGLNTDTLLMEAAKGAEAAGAEIVKFDLFRLEKYTGCISCCVVSGLSMAPKMPYLPPSAFTVYDKFPCASRSIRSTLLPL